MSLSEASPRGHRVIGAPINHGDGKRVVTREKSIVRLSERLAEFEPATRPGTHADWGTTGGTARSFWSSFAISADCSAESKSRSCVTASSATPAGSA
jgi:hypothetical protein